MGYSHYHFCHSESTTLQLSNVGTALLWYSVCVCLVMHLPSTFLELLHKCCFLLAIYSFLSVCLLLSIFPCSNIKPFCLSFSVCYLFPACCLPMLSYYLLQAVFVLFCGCLLHSCAFRNIFAAFNLFAICSPLALSQFSSPFASYPLKPLSFLDF